jgi:hypothetical protein
MPDNYLEEIMSRNEDELMSNGPHTSAVFLTCTCISPILLAQAHSIHTRGRTCGHTVQRAPALIFIHKCLFEVRCVVRR